MWINKNEFLDYPGTEKQKEKIKKWEKEGLRFSPLLSILIPRILPSMREEITGNSKKEIYWLPSPVHPDSG